MWMSAYQTIQTRVSLPVSTLLVVTSASAQSDITSVLTARNVKVMCLRWRLCSPLVPERGARVRFSLGTKCERTLLSSIHTRIQARYPYPSTRSRPCVQALKKAPVSSVHAFAFCAQCQGTSARAPSVNITLGPIQTRCPWQVLGHGHQSEHSFLSVLKQSSEDRARAPFWARAPVWTGFCQFPRFFLTPPYDTVNKMAGAKLMNENNIARWAPRSLCIVFFFYCPGIGPWHGRLLWTGPYSLMAVVLLGS